MLKILKRIVLSLSLIIVLNMVFILGTEAKEVKCNYGSNYVITLNDGSINASIVSNPLNYYSLIGDALRASDLQNSDGTFKCPDNLYVKTVFGDSSRSVILSFSFLAATYSDTSSIALTSGTVDGIDINNQNLGNPTDDESVTPPVVTPPKSEPINCDDLKYTDADKAYNIIDEIFNIIMLAGPILLVIYGIIDFSKATLASDEQALKKAGVNFGKRAIAAILLFLIPMIINIILGIAFNAGVFGDLTEIPATCITE